MAAAAAQQLVSLGCGTASTSSQFTENDSLLRPPPDPPLRVAGACSRSTVRHAAGRAAGVQHVEHDRAAAVHGPELAREIVPPHDVTAAGGREPGTCTKRARHSDLTIPGIGHAHVHHVRVGKGAGHRHRARGGLRRDPQRAATFEQGAEAVRRVGRRGLGHQADLAGKPRQLAQVLPRDPRPARDQREGVRSETHTIAPPDDGGRRGRPAVHRRGLRYELDFVPVDGERLGGQPARPDRLRAGEPGRRAVLRREEHLHRFQFDVDTKAKRDAQECERSIEQRLHADRPAQIDFDRAPPG